MAKLIIKESIFQKLLREVLSEGEVVDLASRRPKEPAKLKWKTLARYAESVAKEALKDAESAAINSPEVDELFDKEVEFGDNQVGEVVGVHISYQGGEPVLKFDIVDYEDKVFNNVGLGSIR